MRGGSVGRLLVASITGDAWRVRSGNVAELAGEVSAADLAMAAEFHGVPGYVRAALLTNGAAPGVVDAVQPAYERGLHTHLRALSDLQLVAAALHRAQAPYVVVKGPVLASCAHERPDLRAYSDLDVVVPPPHFGRAVQELLAAGCQPVVSRYAALIDVQAGELPMRLPSGGALDLHWHTINAPAVRSAFPVDLPALVDRALWVDLGGVTVPVLDQPDAIVYVAMHMMLSGAHRLVWTKDVERLAAAPDLAWDEVMARAQSARAGLVVASALRLAGQLLGGSPAARIGQSLAGRSAWPAVVVAAARLSRAQDAASNRRLVSRVAARSTRYGVPSGVVEVARKVRAARGPRGVLPTERPAETGNAATLEDFTTWADNQRGPSRRGTH